MTPSDGGTWPLARTLAWVVLAVMAIALLYTGWIASAFEPGALPTYIPRLVTLAIAGAVGALVVSALRPAVGRRKQPGHRARGRRAGRWPG